MEIRKAVRSRQFLRLALMGPTGGGKTFSALRIASAIAQRVGGSIVVIDSEEGSSELYAGEVNPDGGVFDFGVIDLSREIGKFRVENYISALKACKESGVKVVVIDSASHAWAGEGGVLEFVDRAGKRNNGNSYTAWREGTPLQQEFVRSILSYPGHVIITMRVKTEYILKEVNGKKVPVRMGLQPVQRDGIEYEFTCVFDLDIDAELSVGKTRCSRLTGYATKKPGAELANILLDWLDSAPLQSERATEPAPSTEGEAEARDSLRRAFMSHWTAAYPPARQKDGLSKEEVEEYNSAHDANRHTLYRAWFGSDSLDDIPIDRVPALEARVRALSAREFKQKADKAINGGSNE